MELKDLRYFCATAELEHITKAAEQLNIAQPYLTRVIHQIEEEVGGELFSKVGRRIKLNSNGAVFYKHAKKVLSDMNILLSEMDYIFDRKEQTITLACNTESFSTHLIRDFNEQNHDYALSILQVKTKDMIPSLLNGSVQFVLSCPPLSTEGVSDVIETIDVFDVMGCLVFPDGHRLLSKPFVTIDDIRDEKLITMPKGSAMRNRLQPIFDAYNYHPKIICESDNLNAITQSVKDGVGFAFVTELIIAEYPELWNNVKQVEIPDAVGHYGLSYIKYDVDNRNIHDFRNFALDFFESMTKKTLETRPQFLEQCQSTDLHK